MKNLLVFILLVVVCTNVRCTRGAPAAVLPVAACETSIEQALKTSEVIDTDGDGIGSCFPVAEQFGCVAMLTCAHVAGCVPPPASVKMPNGDQAPVVAVVLNEQTDVALIWVRANPHLRVSLLPLATANPPRGAEAVLGGYPLDCGLWLSQGLIGSPLPPGMCWTSVPIYYGCSGGPMVVNGRVVGIARGILVDYNRQQRVSTLSHIVLVDSFRDWLKESLSFDPSAK